MIPLTLSREFVVVYVDMLITFSVEIFGDDDESVKLLCYWVNEFTEILWGSANAH